jgi:hypothetical protein
MYDVKRRSRKRRCERRCERSSSRRRRRRRRGCFDWDRGIRERAEWCERARERGREEERRGEERRGEERRGEERKGEGGSADVSEWVEGGEGNNNGSEIVGEGKKRKEKERKGKKRKGEGGVTGEERGEERRGGRWTINLSVPYHSAVPCWTIFYHSTELRCDVLCCTALYCTVLRCTILYCTALYYTLLYCTFVTSSWKCIVSSPLLYVCHVMSCREKTGAVKRGEVQWSEVQWREVKRGHVQFICRSISLSCFPPHIYIYPPPLTHSQPSISGLLYTLPRSTFWHYLALPCADVSANWIDRACFW